MSPNTACLWQKDLGFGTDCVSFGAKYFECNTAEYCLGALLYKKGVAVLWVYKMSALYRLSYTYLFLNVYI